MIELTAHPSEVVELAGLGRAGHPIRDWINQYSDVRSERLALPI